MNDIVKTNLVEAGILEIQLNRPEQLNALSRDVLETLSTLFQKVKQDQSIRAVLLTGAGKGFCAGADIKQLAQVDGTSGLQFATFGQEVMRQLETIGKPSLAAIHGFAFGGGCELAMAASIRIAADNAIFGQPEIKLGVIPGFGGTQRLSRLVGLGRAMELCLTGRRLKANEALQWGLVTEVTSPDDLRPRALAMLKELAGYSPFALQSIMNVIDQGFNIPLQEALSLEALQFGLCCTTADKKEGVSAFLEKRTPQFQNS